LIDVYPSLIDTDREITSSTLFTSKGYQMVRLPKAGAFPENVHQVDIRKIGHSRVIVPQGKRWDELFQNGPRARGLHGRASAAADARDARSNS